MSGSVLDAVRRVHEEKFFKTEQEAEVRRYIARLKAEGRYESAMEAARRRRRRRASARARCRKSWRTRFDWRGRMRSRWNDA